MLASYSSHLSRLPNHCREAGFCWIEAARTQATPPIRGLGTMRGCRTRPSKTDRITSKRPPSPFCLSIMVRARQGDSGQLDHAAAPA